ncbi:DUF4003 family protein [Haloplasma contractile]|uniref:ABC transporter protein n=1 Tax=Haloplasma contractile SSD-17B TaxID=1033810 RepID=U2FRG3_9MOLU|nr:DUF4003 family protein [Haloplasma contractile]ERJ13549.1 ABC transporter protein [Haloplasma contractile SSD-17B]
MDLINGSKNFEQFNDVFHSLNDDDAVKWKADRRILMMISAIYTTNSHPFDIELFKSTSDYIKKQVGFFSPLRTNHRFALATALIVKHKEPKTYFKTFKIIYQALIKSGFKRNSFTVIAALVLLMETESKEIENETVKKRAKKAYSLYRGMRSKHLFLTSDGDYPLALLLSRSNQQVEQIINDSEYFYNTLSNHQFEKGNDLQFLAHILMLNDRLDNDMIIANCLSTYERMTKKEIKIKRIYYPIIGLLSTINDVDQLLDEIILLQTELDFVKKYKYNKDLNFIIAVLLIVRDYIDKHTRHEISITTSLHMIVEAHLAAMIATITAVTEASFTSTAT